MMLCLLPLSIWAAKEEKVNSLAVLTLENRTADYSAFVNGVPDMLITELVQVEGLKLVERTKVHEAMKAMDIEKNGLTKETHVKIGQWLGADQILIGSFSKILGEYRMDVRIIEVGEGTIRFAAASTKPANQLLSMISDLGVKLKDSFRQKKYKGESINALQNEWNPGVPKVTQQVAPLRVEFKMKLGLFTERAFPIQKVRLWVDDELHDVSEPITQFNTKQLIFHTEIPTGNRRIRLEHGMISRNGKWARAFESQPEEIEILIRKGRGTSIKYEEKVYDNKESFSNIHLMP